MTCNSSNSWALTTNSSGSVMTLLADGKLDGSCDRTLRPDASGQVDVANHRINALRMATPDGALDVTSLVLDNNILTFLTNVVWPANLSSLSIDHNNLSFFLNMTLPSNLKTLSLRSNQLEAIYGVDFPSTLEMLDLGQNHHSFSCFEVRESNVDVLKKALVVSMTHVPVMKEPSCNCDALAKSLVIQGFNICVLPDDVFMEFYAQPTSNTPVSDEHYARIDVISRFPTSQSPSEVYGNLPPIESSVGTSSKLPSLSIALIAIGCFVAIVTVLAFFVAKRRHRKHATSFFLLMKDDNATAFNNCCTDNVFEVSRIPTRRITFGDKIAKGAYGEVYKGKYRHQNVAIKKLRRDVSKSAKSIHSFTEEVKMMASLRHPHIVQFIGVTGDSLKDLCVVYEYMTRGDLHTLIKHFRQEGHPKGYDRRKLGIARDIALGLSYLHSLDPTVLHRDLKSKNVLLDEQYRAKLTDFGISRENDTDKTMTAGIGTYYWMAPEVMIGSRYDERADVFSFGVVLSELDTHLKPYHHVGVGVDGKKIPDARMMLMIAVGSVQVQFSDQTKPEILEIAEQCLSIQASNRPSALDIANKIQSFIDNDGEDITLL